MAGALAVVLGLTPAAASWGRGRAQSPPCSSAPGDVVDELVGQVLAAAVPLTIPDRNAVSFEFVTR